MEKKVVITGTGMVTPIGHTTPDTWKGLCEGRNGIDDITRFDASGFRTRIAGEVNNFDADYLRKTYPIGDTLAGVSEYEHLLSAIDEALRDAHLPITGDERLLIGSGGSNKLGFPELSPVLQLYTEYPEARHKILPLLEHSSCRDMLYFGQEDQAPAFLINRLLGLRHPPRDINVACATGAQVVAAGYDLIQEGLASRVICGSVQPLEFLILIAFVLLDALSDNNDCPARASRPFDRKRNGLVLAEGSACLVLEEMEQAVKRGAPHIYAEVSGYGVTTDAYRLTDPHPDAIHSAKAMELALKSAGIQPEMVDYINAHGTSTVENDRLETRAIKEVFGQRSPELLINATKSMTGHMLVTSGLVETIVTALSLKTAKLHPTVNLETPDPECDLNYLPGNASIEGPIKTALTNSFGFGGHNISLVLKKVG